MLIKLNIWIPPIRLWKRMICVKYFIKNDFHSYLNIDTHLPKKDMRLFSHLYNPEDMYHYLKWLSKNRNKLLLKT